jgi:cyclase
MVHEPFSAEALPVITFDESLSIHFNGEEIRVIHLPGGHTDGDAVIFFTGSNVVHMGDHLFNGIFPFVDLDSGGNVVQMAANVKKVLDELPADVKIIPGHGPLASRADLVAFHEMLLNSCAYVREQQEKGLDLEAIQAADLPENLVPWSHGFLKPATWLAIVHQSMGNCKAEGSR